MSIDRTPEDLEQARLDYERTSQANEKQTYTPRPKWQLVMAWVLIGIVVLGIINIVYWQMHG